MPGLTEESEQRAMVEWRVQGGEFANCNCAYGCPCTSGTTNATGKMDLKQSHAHFAKINLNQEGVLDEAAA
jgi:hypothetical protein